MSDIRLFRIANGHAVELATEAHALEKHLQAFVENNLEALLATRFLASEHSTGPVHGGRIDSLGVDENNSPVIIEYKRGSSQNVINQGLFYLDWLLDHKAEFKLLVQDRLGQDVASLIDWSGPRLICIAQDFTKYDAHAVKQMRRNIELLRYRRYADDFLILELVNSAEASLASSESGNKVSLSSSPKPNDQVIADNRGTHLGDLYDELRERILALSDDVQEKHLKQYVAFKKLKNFATVEVQKKKLLIFLKLDPSMIDLAGGFTRDVSEIGHWGTGNIEVTVATAADLERAWPLVVRSYETG